LLFRSEKSLSKGENYCWCIKHENPLIFTLRFDGAPFKLPGSIVSADVQTAVIDGSGIALPHNSRLRVPTPQQERSQDLADCDVKKPDSESESCPVEGAGDVGGQGRNTQQTYADKQVGKAVLECSCTFDQKQLCSYILSLINVIFKFHLISRARCRLPAERQEVLRALDGLSQASQQLLQVFVAVHKIDVRSIHN
jgi:hypothetical protein